MVYLPIGIMQESVPLGGCQGSNLSSKLTQLVSGLVSKASSTCQAAKSATVIYVLVKLEQARLTTRSSLLMSFPEVPTRTTVDLVLPLCVIIYIIKYIYIYVLEC